MAANQEPQLAPIAIVGMSCRLSGDVSNPEDFWTLLSRSRSGWREIPEDRFSMGAFHHPNPQKKGCINAKGGYFMNQDLSRFDAPFFNITEQEALAMDPQQRLLLECTYEALENAGVPKETIAGRNIGVFVGGALSDYRMGTLRDVNRVPMFDATGNHQSIQAGRLSYYFDFHGPCSSIDTACSSSLYALHQAVQSIRSGESEQAIVAAANLHLQPDDYISMSMLGILNEHGKTFAFDERAKSGFARGEGVGALLLKPLDQALKDNDKIRSVIVNTGTNQDGKTVGISTPNGEAQERLMRDVYARAGINPEDVGFIEAHGTGTKVGDPIEAGALSRVFGNGRTKRFPLYIGSVKTNVGHLENASGIASIIKATLMLEKGFILPNFNFEKANPNIPLDQWNMKVPINIRPWPKNKRYISINNFGFGGSNAHAVLERPPVSLLDLPVESKNQRPKLFVLSAHDEGALKRLASQLGVYIEQHPEVFQKRLIRDIAYTLGERRSHLQWRIALAATSLDELALSLNGIDALPSRAAKVPKLAFVYTGQGAQWAGMGRELLSSHRIFSDTVNAADDCLKRMGASFSLIEELNKSKDESQIGKAHISQPICTAVQLGLTALLESWGIKPSMVVGHSSGEIGAAFATGAITLEAAMAAAYHRGQAAQKIKAKFPDLRGSMIAVGSGPAEVKDLIQSLGLTSIVVACENSPSSVTVSGDEDAIDKLAVELENRSIFNRKLRVDVAYHSPHMQLVADDYMASISNTAGQDCDGVAFYSSLNGNKLDSTVALGPSYWVDNLTKPVLFSSALKELYEDGQPDMIVEIGPHSALEGPIKQILKGISSQASSVKYQSSLVRNQHATTTALKLAGALFVKGYPVNFSAINEDDDGAQKPSLVADFAPYPWADRKYWFESRYSKQHRLKPFPRHDLLGTLEDNYSELDPTWRNVITVDDVPWLKHHKMQSLTTMPLAAYLCMAVEASMQRAGLRGIPAEQILGYRLREIYSSKAFVLDDSSEYETVVTLRSYAEGTRAQSSDWDEFRIASWNSSRGWLEHCTGLVALRKQDTSNAVSQGSTHGARARKTAADNIHGGELSTQDFYSELEGFGAEYGSLFQLQPSGGLKVSREYATSGVTVPDTASSMPFNHETPSILPAAFTDLFVQLTLAIFGAGRGEMKSLFMPTAIKELEISSNLPGSTGQQVQVVAHGKPNPASPGPVDFYVDVWNTEHSTEPLLKMDGFRMTPVNGDMGQEQVPRQLCYKIQWEQLNPLDLESPGSEKSLEMAPRRCSNNTNVLAEPIVIISDKDEGDPLVGALVNLADLHTGSKPIIVPFSKVEPSAVPYICLAELDGPLLHGLSADTFNRLQKLLLTSSSLLWVGAGGYRYAEKPENNMAQGLLRSVRSEASKTAALLDLDPNSRLNAYGRAELILEALTTSLVKPQDDTPVDFEFAEEDGQLVVPRVVESEDTNVAIFRETQDSAPYLQEFDQPGRRLKVAVGTYGALDSLYFKDDIELPLAEDEIEIKVAATGMNFKDVVIAMGQVSSPYLGVECSGIVSKVGSEVTSLSVGDRVCAMSLGAYSTFARCPATSAAIIPENMSFETAASIPVVYSTAYYGIVNLAHLQPGERILIHAASGGVGQAAVQLAQMIGAEIYATVGSAEKKELLIDTYGIPEDHIFYSRNTDFGPAIREATNGEGVDVVINSLAGDLLRETWECLSHFGRFVEIGKRDITSNTRLEMSKFEYNCTFSSVDLTLVAAERPRIMKRVLTSIMNLLAEDVVKPVGPIITVGISEVETALRKLQSGKTSGKVIVSPRAGERVKATHPQRSSTLLQAEATYFIIGGTGGIGRSMARRMIQLGARHIVLLSRTSRVTGELGQLSEYARTQDANIYLRACDVADEKSVGALVEESARTLPPVRGVIHAAMVLRDVLFEKMTFEDYDLVVRSKVYGAWNFHKALLNTPLDFFVVLSSVAGIVGNRGQAAYSAANTYLDAFTQHRLRSGLPATCLNLGAVSGVGYLAENSAKQAQVLKNLSGSTVDESEVLVLLELAINGKIGVMGNEQCVTGLDFSDGTSLPYYASDGRFVHLRHAAIVKSQDASDLPASASLTIAQEVQRAATREEAQGIVTIGLRDKLGAILMLPPEVLQSHQGNAPVTAFGLDSLNAIELRNWITKELQAHLQILELLTSSSLGDLASLVLKKSRLGDIWRKNEEKTEQSS
ncbi:hypothetical protein B0J15DRAFT_446835 [Fusarium solani]|uniref:Polyketide synthase n=1 Tax=Fusarium solani TaxID=169388 RepID=A0A9P9KJD7_FUSSL|nr:uncharacterized protein B0J15DRAFT_446835 [Fusarium solani]KAH7254804.1 hypothetical protein B0J15DRAFT_446835 [Fusarium solani]